MKTVTLQIDNSIYEKFCWLLTHFSKNEIKILEQSDDLSDDDYLRSQKGMVESIQVARAESEHLGETLENSEFETLWANESAQRAARCDLGNTKSISGEEVAQKARALLR